MVENLLREIAGEKPLPSFDGHANCYVETGYHKAMLLDFNYDVEPVEGTFPWPVMGPFSLLKESHLNHMGKMAFDWVYWHMLLPGYLPMVPLLPSHMSFVGKDVAGTSQVRRSRAMRVGDVMTAEPVTVTQGTPLAETARLLTEHNVSGLPVVDVDDRLIGVVTEADFFAVMDVSADTGMKKLFDAIIRRDRPRKRMGSLVDDIMTAKPVTARKDDSVQRAIEVMERNRIKRLVVTDSDERVEGVVSRPDLVKLFLMNV